MLTFSSLPQRVSECHLRFDPQRLHLALCRRDPRRRHIPRNALRQRRRCIRLRSRLAALCEAPGIIMASVHHILHPIRMRPHTAPPWLLYNISISPDGAGPRETNWHHFPLLIFPLFLLVAAGHTPWRLYGTTRAAVPVCCLTVRSPLVTDFNFGWRGAAGASHGVLCHSAHCGAML